MVLLLKRRELRGQWQRACELLLTEADIEAAPGRLLIGRRPKLVGDKVWRLPLGLN
jgi:hypothetical protein